MQLLRSFWLTFRSRRVVGWQYVSNLLLGLLVLLPSFSTLQAETGQSLEYMNLLEGFDYSVFEDFMQHHAGAIRPLVAAGRWLGLAYLVLTVFFTGGTLLALHNQTAFHPRTSSLRKPAVSFGAFLSACVHYFPRYLRLVAFTLLLIILWTAFILLIIALIMGPFGDVLNEPGYALIAVVGLLLIGLPVLFILCVADYARILMFRQDERRALRGFEQGWRFVRQNIRLTYGNALLLWLIGAFFFLIYLGIEAVFPTTGWPTILLLFILQQAFVWGRVFLKVWKLATASQVIDRVDIASETRAQPAQA